MNIPDEIRPAGTTGVRAPGADRFPAGMEMTVLAAVLLLFLIANWLASGAQPVFSDEPCYTDPAASHVLGTGFTSGAWYAQPEGEFFASNVPLHAMALIPWMETFGFGILQARSINWLYSILGVLLLWRVVGKTGWIQDSAYRMAACVLFLFTESAYSINQLGRPDGITFLIAAVAVWTLGLQSRPLRLGILCVAGAAASWAGLQLVVAFFFTCLVCFGVWRLRLLPEMTALGLGVLLGLVALLVLYQHHGVWNRFLESVFPHAASRNIYSFTGFFSDRSFLLLAASCALILIHAIAVGGAGLKKTAVFGLAMLVVLPLGLLACGKFSSHYTWMPSLAAVFATISVLERMKPARLVLAMGLMMAALGLIVGYPRRVGISIAFENDRIHPRTERFISAHIEPGDHVIYAAQAYFPVKRNSEKAYYYNWYPKVMSQSEADGVNVLVIDPRTLEEMQHKVGGGWQLVGTPFRYPVRRFPRKETWMELAFYRRAIPAGAAGSN